MDASTGVKFGNMDDWRVDPEKARNGVPFDLGMGRALIVRRANLYDRAVAVHFENVDWKTVEVVQRIYARHLVVDWRGICDDTGAEVAYTPDACVALFQFAPDIWDGLQRFSLDRANYRITKAKEDSDAVKTLRDGEAVPAHIANS